MREWHGLRRTHRRRSFTQPFPRSDRRCDTHTHQEKTRARNVRGAEIVRRLLRSMSPKAGGEDAVAFSTSQLLPIENEWLRDVSTRLRARQTPWEGFQRADLVKANELPMLRAAERAGQQGQMETVVQKGPEYARLYIQLLGKLSRPDTIQSVLLLVDDLMQAAPELSLIHI